ncbi:MAG: small conductance mechanosensitive channel [Thermoleophilaceae bacterium]|jgi:small-conductance mechanosensitive channel|nr:small conductance mechanosensitive channel [Thermoleophilaceae bacterium]
MYPTLVRELGGAARVRARRARREAILILPLVGGVLLAYRYRLELFGVDMPVRAASVIALVILGWALARDVGRAVGPILFKRLDPGTAGTLGFLIRLFTVMLAVLVALRIAGLKPETLAVGGAVTAVLFGLAAQQTIGNLVAGTVLLSARPFRIGDRIRLHSGATAGAIEGTVVGLGLLYTILRRGADPIMVPNSVVLGSAVEPLREPAKVDLLARFPRDVKPSVVQEIVQERITVPTVYRPHIELEEVDGDEVLVRIEAVPQHDRDGAKLADEVLAAVAESRG